MDNMTTFNWTVAASATIDGALLLALLFRRARLLEADSVAIGPKRGVGGLLVALTVVAVAFILKLVAFRAIGVHLFGWIRLAYVDAVVMIPIVCTLVLLNGIRRNPGARRFTSSVYALAALGVAGAPIGFYATYVEPYCVQLETATVDVQRHAKVPTPIRLGVLADIQTDRVTDYERGAVERLMAERPDIVLLPGDVLQCTRREYAAQIDEMRQLVKTIDAPGGAFFVEGDVDELDRLRPLFWDTPVRMLVNEIAETRVGKQRVLIGGIELNYRSAAARKTIQELIDMPRNGRIKVLVAHRPDAVMMLPKDADIDVVVAGHTHGGQIVIPGFGPPVTLSDVPRSIGAGGLHEYNDNAIYVSRGVGMERGQSPRLRLFCPPEISLLTLKNP
ncbi:MAG: phosphohydrolase [Phycisphaerales bacterium]|nr:phosphohydrolase [Phycisphaerales bacterium]